MLSISLRQKIAECFPTFSQVKCGTHRSISAQTLDGHFLIANWRPKAKPCRVVRKFSVLPFSERRSSFSLFGGDIEAKLDLSRDLCFTPCHKMRDVTREERDRDVAGSRHRKPAISSACFFRFFYTGNPQSTARSFFDLLKITRQEWFGWAACAESCNANGQILLKLHRLEQKWHI